MRPATWAHREEPAVSCGRLIAPQGMVVSVDRIAGVVRARPVQPGTREGQFLPAPGESLLLTCEETAGEDLIATTPGGLSLRLAGLGKLGRQLRAGDTVLVRVVANEPVLELEVEGEALPPARREPDFNALNRQPAMRLDPAVMRQIIWRVPDAAALAAMMRETVVVHSSSPGESWFLPVPAWGPMPLLLRLVVAPEREPRAARTRRRRMGLQVELSSPTFGPIVLELHVAPDGAELMAACEERAAALLVRDSLPAIAAAVARTGVRLVRARVLQGRAAAARIREIPAVPQSSPFSTDPPGADLYRVAAEAVIALQTACRRRGVSPASR